MQNRPTPQMTFIRLKSGHYLALSENQYLTELTMVWLLKKPTLQCMGLVWTSVIFLGRVTKIISYEISYDKVDREKEELLCRTSSLRFQQFSFSHFCFQFSISFHFLVAKILGSAHKCQLTVGNKHDNGFPVQSFPSYIFVFIIFI